MSLELELIFLEEERKIWGNSIFVLGGHPKKHSTCGFHNPTNSTQADTSVTVCVRRPNRCQRLLRGDGYGRVSRRRKGRSPCRFSYLLLMRRGGLGLPERDGHVSP